MNVRGGITISSKIEIFVAEHSANASFPPSVVMVSAHLKNTER
jgi:hypothetical protein